MQFKDAQAQFSAHIRDPDNNPRPADIEDRRMGIYRELFYNNVKGFVESGFPVLHSLYEDDVWQSLIRQFFAHHSAASPYFLDISKEFVMFLADEYQPNEHDPDFLVELAHYEWVELAVATAKESRGYRAVTNVEMDPLYLSDAAQVVCYHYPVQTISAQNQPQHPDDTPSYICVYRDSDDDVQFLALNAMTALLLDAIDNHEGIAFLNLCSALHQQAPNFTYEQIEQGARQIVSELVQRQIIQTLDC